MCQRLDIPVKYFRRLPDRMKAFVTNYDLIRLPDKSFPVRGKGEVTIKSFVLEETHMYLKIILEEIWDVESGLKAGIMIGNSEVGMGSASDAADKPFGIVNGQIWPPRET